MLGLMVISAVLALLIDQLSKLIVVSRLSETQVGWRRSILSIQLVTGRTQRPWPLPRRGALVGLWALAILGVVFYVSVTVPAPGTLTHVGLGGAIGGATGNLLDRLWRGGVVDFIRVGFWPTFNVADVAIVGGALLALSMAG
jgi:signal peptidase II